MRARRSDWLRERLTATLTAAERRRVAGAVVLLRRVLDADQN